MAFDVNIFRRRKRKTKPGTSSDAYPLPCQMTPTQNQFAALNQIYLHHQLKSDASKFSSLVMAANELPTEPMTPLDYSKKVEKIQESSSVKDEREDVTNQPKKEPKMEFLGNGNSLTVCSIDHNKNPFGIERLMT